MLKFLRLLLVFRKNFIIYMDNQEIKKNIASSKKWYYYYNFDEIEVKKKLKNKKDLGINNWKKIRPIIKSIFKGIEFPYVFDIGCNMGVLDFEMCKLGAKVYAVDKNIAQAKFLEKFLLENKHQKFDVFFDEMDVTQSMPSQKFDIITMFSVIYHFGDKIDFVFDRLPKHSIIIIQGNTKRIKKRGQHMAGIEGISRFLKIKKYSVCRYLEKYSKPIVVGKK